MAAMALVCTGKESSDAPAARTPRQSDAHILCVGYSVYSYTPSSTFPLTHLPTQLPVSFSTRFSAVRTDDLLIVF